MRRKLNGKFAFRFSLGALSVVSLCVTLSASSSAESAEGVLPPGAISYDGYQQVRFNSLTPQQRALIEQSATAVLSHHSTAVDGLDVVLAPGQLEQLAAIPHELVSQDIGQDIRLERGTAPPSADYDEFYNEYRSTAEVHERVGELAMSSARVKMEVLGTSVEGVDIPALRFGKTGAPGILVQGTQHAREWISPMVVMCIAQTLADDYGKDERVTNAVNGLEIIIAPIVNPDGYEHSRGGNRLWRKNRGQPSVDLNRNWGAGFGIGATSDTNSDVYPGDSAFSAPETKAMSDFISANPQLEIFLDYHSDAQAMAHPLALKAEPPANIDEILEMANLMADEINKVNDVNHSVIRTGMGGPAGGLAADYAVENHGLLAITPELRRGSSSFVLAPNLIVETCNENLAGFLAVTDMLLDKLGIEPTPPDGGGGAGGAGAAGDGGAGGAGEGGTPGAGAGGTPGPSAGMGGEASPPAPTAGSGPGMSAGGAPAPTDTPTPAGAADGPTLLDNSSVEADEGCGCRVHGTGTSSGALGFLALSLLAGLRRRRWPVGFCSK